MEEKQNIEPDYTQSFEQKKQALAQIILQADNTLVALYLEDFLKFSPLVNESKIEPYIKEIPNFKYSLQILHVFLYFILNVGNKLNLDPTYEEICRKKVAQFYVRKYMKIQAYEYALVCSRMIGTKVQFCLHIIYFLVYGRLASGPYIQSTCNSKQFKYRKNFMVKSSNPTRNYSKIKNGSLSKTTTYQSDVQFRNLKRQLKGILKIQKNPNENFLLKPKTERKNIQLSIFRKEQSKKKNCNEFLPTRVQNQQNSALIYALSNLKSKISKPIRKKKFEDMCFDWLNHTNPGNIMQDGKNDEKFLERQNQVQRKTACNFYSIAQRLKNSSRVLDRIRTNDLRENHTNKTAIQNRKKMSDRSYTLKQDFQILQKQQLEEQKKQQLNKQDEEQSEQESIEEEKHQVMISLLRKQGQIELDSRQSGSDNSLSQFFIFSKRPILKTLKYKQQYKNFLDNLIFNVQFEN